MRCTHCCLDYPGSLEKRCEGCGRKLVRIDGSDRTAATSLLYVIFGMASGLVVFSATILVPTLLVNVYSDLALLWGAESFGFLVGIVLVALRKQVRLGQFLIGFCPAAFLVSFVVFSPWSN